MNADQGDQPQRGHLGVDNVQAKAAAGSAAKNADQHDRLQRDHFSVDEGRAATSDIADSLCE
eukprot:12420462-Karenia_brevis.AAC.1